MFNRVIGAALSATLVSAVAMTAPTFAQSADVPSVSVPSVSVGMQLAAAPAPDQFAPLEGPQFAPLEDPLDDMNRVRESDLPADAPQCSAPTTNCEDFDETAEDLRRRLMDAAAEGSEDDVLADLADDGLCEAEQDALEQALATMSEASPEAAAAVVQSIVSAALSAASESGQAAINLINVAMISVSPESPADVLAAPEQDAAVDPVLDGDLFAQMDEVYAAAEMQAASEGCALAYLGGFETAAGVNLASAPAAVFGSATQPSGINPGALGIDMDVPTEDAQVSVSPTN